MGLEREESRIGERKIGLERVFVEYFFLNNELIYLAPF